MAPIALILILMFSTTGVVAASNSARPGDTLFIVDKTVEDIRLALANGDNKTKLEVQFATERLQELSSILKEALRTSAVGTSTASSSSTTNSNTDSIFEVEADVFSDTTIVTLEINGRKTAFESVAQTREEVIAEIISRYNVDEATVEAALSFEIEDRASTSKDRAHLNLSKKDEARVNEAASLTLNYLLNGSFDDTTKDSLFAELENILSGLYIKVNPEKISIKDKNSRIEIRLGENDSRIEYRDGENRIKIREKDGELKIETKMKDRDDNSHDDDEDEDESRKNTDNSTSTIDRFRAEVDVLIDKTIVNLRINDSKTSFTTTATTKAEVVAEIVSRYNVDKATVEAGLDFKIEKIKDLLDDDSDNDDDDSDDDSSSDNRDEN